MSDIPAAAEIRLLGLDVDGVLTDNALFLGEVQGERVEMKRFDVQDGMGHVLLRGSGIEVVWVSGRQSAATTLRATELRVAEVVQGNPRNKVATMERLMAERGLTWKEVAFVGDDLADLGVLQLAGLPIAVANAGEEVKSAAAYVTTAPGGHGAVREVVELLLKNRGQWEAAISRYRGASEVSQ